MAADEYYDAVGEVLSYVLSAEDFIVGQENTADGKSFIINRDNTNLQFFAGTDTRYFIVIYRFSISQTIASAYEGENQILRGHLEKFDIDESNLRDEDLDNKVALRRVKDIDDEQAERLVTDIRALAMHTGCRIDSMYKTDPWDDEEQEIWDGVTVAGLLYPYESDFGPRDYEQVAQEVISVGYQIDDVMKKLDVMEEIGFKHI